MYQIQYSCWDEKNFPGFRRFLIGLEGKSKIALNSGFSERKKEEQAIDTFLHNMEYYYAALFKEKLIHGGTYSYSFNQLKRLSLLKILPVERRKYYAITHQGNISLNPDLPPIRDLSTDEATLLVHAHELGHIVNDRWVGEAMRFGNELYQDPRTKMILHNMGLDSASFLKDGFCLLDELVAQETAERVTYLKKGMNRPPRETRHDKAIFLCQSYRTNYNLYGEFQEIGARFARTLDFLHCTSADSDDEVLKRLVQVAFRGDLIDQIKRELALHPEKMDSFIILLATMGKVKDSTYRVVGLSASNGMTNVNPYLGAFRNITDSYKK